MLKRMWRGGLRYSMGLAAAAAILAPAAVHAQIRQVSSDHRQAIGLTIGGFFPKGEDSRVEGDVLFADLDDLVFEVGDFTGPSISGEWLFALGDFVEGGVGAGFYQRNVPSIYREFQNANGSEIEQDLKLRIVPVTATVRFLPIGRGNTVEPYVGVGIGAFNWRYSETGEFVDNVDSSIFRASYVAKGTAVGPVILAGLRAPIADAWDIGGELQYQRASGDIEPEVGLLGDKIDLGGWHALLTMHIRF